MFWRLDGNYAPVKVAEGGFRCNPFDEFIVGGCLG